MGRAYWHMVDANYVGADKYFQTRRISKAAQRGPGGRWTAEVIRYEKPVNEVDARPRAQFIV